MTCIYTPITDNQPPMLKQIEPVDDYLTTKEQTLNKFIEVIKNDDLFNELLKTLSTNIKSRKNYTEKETRQFLKFSKLNKNSFTLDITLCAYDAAILNNIINKLINDIENDIKYKFVNDFLNKRCLYGGCVSGLGLYCYKYPPSMVNKGPVTSYFYSTYSNYSIYDEVKLKFVTHALASYDINILFDYGRSD